MKHNCQKQICYAIILMIFFAIFSQSCSSLNFLKKQTPDYKMADLEKFYRKKEFNDAAKAALFLLALDEFQEGEKGRTYFLLGACYKKLDQGLKAKHHFKNAMYEDYDFTEEEERLAVQAKIEYEKLDETRAEYAESHYKVADIILEEVLEFRQDDWDKIEANFLRGLVTFYIQDSTPVPYYEYFYRVWKIDIDFKPKAFTMNAEERRIYDEAMARFLREPPPKTWWGKHWKKVAIVSGGVVAGVLICYIWGPCGDGEPELNDLPAAPDFPGGK